MVKRKRKKGYVLGINAERTMPLYPYSMGPCDLLIAGADRSEALQTWLWLGTNKHP